MGIGALFAPHTRTMAVDTIAGGDCHLDALEAAGYRLAEEADRRFPAGEPARTELDAELRAWMMRHK